MRVFDNWAAGSSFYGSNTPMAAATQLMVLLRSITQTAKETEWGGKNSELQLRTAVARSLSVLVPGAA